MLPPGRYRAGRAASLRPPARPIRRGSCFSAPVGGCYCCCCCCDQNLHTTVPREDDCTNDVVVVVVYHPMDSTTDPMPRQCLTVSENVDREDRMLLPLTLPSCPLRLPQNSRPHDPLLRYHHLPLLVVVVVVVHVVDVGKDGVVLTGHHHVDHHDDLPRQAPGPRMIARPISIVSCDERVDAPARRCTDSSL